MLTALEALKELREGNARFAGGDRSRGTFPWHPRRSELVTGQEPFAVILGCSDSRVPVEIIFDQGLGDLFVIRVAGNIVAPSMIGSVEFAAERFGTRLVVVLGHTRCGAVQATLEAMERGGSPLSPGLRSIVERIRPSVEGLLEMAADGPRKTTADDPEKTLAAGPQKQMAAGPQKQMAAGPHQTGVGQASRLSLGADAAGLARRAVRANVRVSASQLRHGSEILERLIQHDGLLVVGAEYALETGVVDFFDGA